MIKLISLTALCLVVACAQADLKAEIQVTVTGGPRASAAGPGGNTLTVTQSGTKIRLQREGQNKWILVDGSRRFYIDDDAKTYSIMDGHPSSDSSPKGSATSSVKLTKKDETKDISGVKATRFDLRGNVTIQPPSGGTGRSGRFGRGRLGGGNGFSLGVSGTVWGIPDVEGFSFADFMGERAQSLGQMGQQLSEAGLILEGNVEINPPAIARGRMETIKIRFETRSLDQSPQDAGRFQWPTSYQKVDPPAPGRFGGSGRE